MVHLERWFCRRNFHFTEVEVTERVISTLLPMEWKLLFHFRENILSVQAYCTVADTALQFESVRRSDDKDRHDIVLVSHNRPGFKSKSPAFFSAGALSIYTVVAMMDELVSGQ